MPDVDVDADVDGVDGQPSHTKTNEDQCQWSTMMGSLKHIEKDGSERSFFNKQTNTP